MDSMITTNSSHRSDEELFKELAEEQEKARVERIIKNSNLGKRFESRTFDTYEQDGNNEHIYAKCYDYATGFKSNKGKGLLLIGSVGTGKTHLAAAVANYLLHELAIAVKFGNITSLLGEIKSSYDENSQITEKKIIDNLSSIELLIIDDIGKERATEWSNNILYTIINRRYEDYKPMVITTNLTLRELERAIGEATVSRLIEMCDGIDTGKEDYRKAKITKD